MSWLLYLCDYKYDYEVWLPPTEEKVQPGIDGGEQLVTEAQGDIQLMSEVSSLVLRPEARPESVGHIQSRWTENESQGQTRARCAQGVSQRVPAFWRVSNSILKVKHFYLKAFLFFLFFFSHLWTCSQTAWIIKPGGLTWQRKVTWAIILQS